MKTKADLCKEEGNKCQKEGNYTAAVIHYTEAIKHEPNSAILHSNRALAFLKIDQLFLAMEDAQKAIKLEPSWPKTCESSSVKKTCTNFRGNDNNICVDQALAGKPVNRTAVRRKGEIEFRAGDYDKALMSYKQALILDPSDQGLAAAISKTNKEILKDRRDASQKPLVYSCIGLMVGIVIVAADQYLPDTPAIQYSILQVLLVAACGGVGYAAAKIKRYFVVSQRKALLEEPLDLLKEIGADAEEQPKETKAAPAQSQPLKHRPGKGRASKQK